MAKNKKKTNNKPKSATKEVTKEQEITIETTEIIHSLNNGNIEEPKSIVTSSQEPIQNQSDSTKSEEKQHSNTDDTISNKLQEENDELRKKLADQEAKLAELLKNLEISKNPTNDDNLVVKLQEKLEQSESAREEAEENYQSLREKISHIKSTLNDRLKSDAAQIETYEKQIESLENTIKSQNARIESLNGSISSLQREAISANRENDKLSHELTQLRTDYQQSSENWSKERNKLIDEQKSAFDQTEKAQRLLQNMELALAEDKSSKNDVNSRLIDLQEQISSQTLYAERYRKERDEYREELKEKKENWNLKEKESRKAYEKLETEFIAFKEKFNSMQKQLLDATELANSLESQKNRLKPMESEIKEKNLLIGKLRHEAVILNEHLTKALRLIKKESEGETCDKQLIGNLIISFVQIPRGDTKKFEVLQVISDYLGWDEEKKVLAGLSRSGTAGLNRGRGSFDDGSGSSGGFMGLFAEFLEREASRRNEQE